MEKDIEELQKIYDNLSTEEEKKNYLKKMFEYRDIVYDKIFNKTINEVIVTTLFSTLNKEKKCLDLSDINNDDIINDRLDKSIKNLNDDLINEDVFLFFCKKIYSIILEYKGEDEIRKLLNESNDNYYINMVLSCINDEKLKIEYLDKLNDNSSKAKIIASLSSDELKINCLDKINSIYYKIEIIKILSSDESKISCLNKINNDYYKIEIIKNLSSEELRINFLEMFNDDSSKSLIIDSLSSEELKIRYIERGNDDYSKARIIETLSSEELKIKYLNKINNYSKKVFILKKIKNRDLILEYFINNNYSVKVINNFFLNENIKLKYSETEVFLEYMKKISGYYNLNYEHLYSLANLVGIDILINTEKENIKDLINLDDKAFNNFINLFKEENIRLNSSNVNDTINVILSNQFKIGNPEILNVFSLIKNLIERNEKEEIIRISQELIGKDLFNEKLKQFNFDGTFEKFIDNLLAKNDINHEKYLEILHNITNEFITLSKNKYINNNRDNLLNKIFCRRYNKTDIIKYVIKEYTFEELKDLFKEIKKDKLNEEIKKLINNEEILKRIIAFKNNPNQIIEDKELYSYMKTFSLLMNILYEQDLLVPKERDQDKISKEKDLIAITGNDIYNIIINLNIKSMLGKDGILSNQELYDKLQEKLKNYKILGYGNYLNKIFKIDELCDGILLSASLLNNYDLIANIIEKKDKENLTIYLRLINTFSDMSNKYALLIGNENYRLIKENPGPHSAIMSYDERIKIVPSLVKTIYERDSITVPPINEIIELKNSQKLEVILGDVTNIDNLTQGERNGSCMRIGGAGKTLFKFCLENEQGFHIKFIDPNTSEFIGRVSGFRNGNTVFLNELRFSLSNKYSNEDLEEACTKVSKMLIEMTKNSSYPIENVIISQEFVMESSKKDKIVLPINDIKDGYNHFHSDVSPLNAILLASSKGNELVDIKLGPNNCERYAPLRKKVQKLESSKELISLKIQMEIIDQLLSGIEFEDCQYNSKFNDIKEGYFGQDWYFLVLENGEILTYIMKNSKNRDLALQEIKKTVPSELLNNNEQLKVELGGIKK